MPHDVNADVHRVKPHATDGSSDGMADPAGDIEHDEGFLLLELEGDPRVAQVIGPAQAREEVLALRPPARMGEVDVLFLKLLVVCVVDIGQIADDVPVRAAWPPVPLEPVPEDACPRWRR
jgi:hypothetical protein